MLFLHCLVNIWKVFFGSFSFVTYTMHVFLLIDNFIYEYCIYTILPYILFPPISSSHVLSTPPQIHSFMFCKYNSYTHINVYVCKFINTACWDNLVFSTDILGLASLSGAAPWKRLILPFTSAIKPVALLWVKRCEILLMHSGVPAGVVNFRSCLCNHMVEISWVELSTTYRRHYLTADRIPLLLGFFYLSSRMFSET